MNMLPLSNLDRLFWQEKDKEAFFIAFFTVHMESNNTHIVCTLESLFFSDDCCKKRKASGVASRGKCTIIGQRGLDLWLVL